MNAALIIDDHALFGGGMRMLLNSMNRFDEVFQSSDPDTAIDAYATRSISLIILDFFIPSFDFRDCAPKLRQVFPDAYLVAVSSSPSRADREAALSCGADIFVAKHMAPTDVLIQLKALLDTGNAGQNSKLEGPAALAAHHGLSPRQTEILIQLARGHSTKEIAQTFEISVETVKSHLSSIYERTGAPGKSAAIQWARERGLL